MRKRSLSLIGTGALGGVMIRAAVRADFFVHSIYNRSPHRAQKLAKETGIETAGSFPSVKKDLGDVIFLAVPDDKLENTAQKLAEVSDDFSGSFVVHCAGGRPLSVLQPLQAKGAAIACFHPIQTFTAASAPSDFEHIYIDISGDEAAVSYLRQFAEALGSRPMEISAKAKPYLHAAAVMAANYMVALVEAAGQTAELGGLDKKITQRALMPLLQQSIANIGASESLIDALSGPIARGDASTVAEHSKLLEQKPELLALYQNMGLILTKMMQESGTLDSQKIRSLEKILSDDDG